MWAEQSDLTSWVYRDKRRESVRGDQSTQEMERVRKTETLLRVGGGGDRDTLPQ